MPRPRTAVAAARAPEPRLEPWLAPTPPRSHPRRPATHEPDALRARRLERRLREQHFRLRRRDLLIDFAAAGVLAIVCLVLAGGLGVVALLVVPFLLGVGVSALMRRRRRSRRGHGVRRARRSGFPAPPR